MQSVLTRLGGVVALTLGLIFTLLAGSASAQISLKPDGPFTPPYSVPTVATAPDAGTPGGPYQPTGASGQYLPQDGEPGSRIQGGPHAPDAASNDMSAKRSEQCGFYVRWDSYYKHCGGAQSIKIRVNFWYGANFRDIWVPRGITNLSTHPYLQGAGMITNAWCIQYC